MTTIAEILGFTNPTEVYNHFWKNHGFAIIGEGGMTESVQAKFSRPENREAAKGFVAKRIHDYFHPDEKKEKAVPTTKAAVTSTTVASAVPLIYDPDILDILHKDAPILAQIATFGWPGAYYKGANISTRDHPIGFLSESESMNMTTLTPSGGALSPVSEPMVIQADIVSVSDFGQRSSEHFLNLRETALGMRFSEAMQLKERAMLYGDPSQNTGDKGLGDSDAPKGFATSLTAAGKATNKNSVSLSGSDALLKDIKAEIKALIKAYGVTPSDLIIATSPEIEDELDNEINVHGRTEVGQGTVNYGAERISIAGVPVLKTHNIDTQADWGGGFTPGHPGDVFILNKRAHVNPSLAPPFILPLGRRGLSDEWVMGDYYCFADRSGGCWGKYLYNYNI
jgi:hypothetical protein